MTASTATRSRPLAQGYTYVGAQGIRNHVGNFTRQYRRARALVNFMLEGKSRDAGNSLVRFVVNSTIGIGGIFDPSPSAGLSVAGHRFRHDAAPWGVPPGPYLYLPVFGPSDPRDVWNIPSMCALTRSRGLAGGARVTDFNWAQTADCSWINTSGGCSSRLDKIKATALDPYATFRSLYRQHRDRRRRCRQINQRHVLTPPDWVPPRRRRH